MTHDSPSADGGAPTSGASPADPGRATFAALGVPEPIRMALAARGIEQPFAIQSATIADAIAGRDVCGRAPTGSGKTIAFGIPVIVGARRGSPGRPTALILAPTRELADQIAAELATFAGDIRIGVVYGGVGYGPQLAALRRGVDVLVACPGRLEDLIQQGEVDLGGVGTVVLDEADRMADMGFMPAVRRLLDQTTPERQTILFSATLDGDVAALTERYQRDPARHEVGDETPDVRSATHLFWGTERSDRMARTVEATTASWPAIVFVRTRHGADRVAKQLSRAGVAAAAIHGGRSQSQRTRALRDFADHRVEALVATDVAARGIHVDGVALVVNFDPPEDHKAYIHRAGRTARAGDAGVVLSLVQPDQRKETRRTQRRVGIDEPVTEPDVAVLRAVDRPTPVVRNEADEPTRTDASDRPQGRGRADGARKGGGQKRRKRKPSDAGRRGSASSQRSGGRSGKAKASRSPKANRRTKRGPARGTKPATPGGPNRKARRAHLQPRS